jgi:hypothetical protein
VKYRSLFLKIFISFWLTMALTIGVLTLMSRISNTESLPERASRGPLREGLTLYSEAAIRVYEREGVKALDEFVRRSLQESGTERCYRCKRVAGKSTGPATTTFPIVYRRYQSNMGQICCLRQR